MNYAHRVVELKIKNQIVSIKNVMRVLKEEYEKCVIIFIKM